MNTDLYLMRRGNMSKFSLDSYSGKVTDVMGKVESSRGELEKLKETKEKLLEAGTEVQSLDIDESIQGVIMDSINENLESVSEQAKELSSDIGQDISELEGMREETQEEMDKTHTAYEKVGDIKGALDALGFGGALNGPLSELSGQAAQLANLNETIIEAQREAEQLSQEFDSL